MIVLIIIIHKNWNTLANHRNEWLVGWDSQTELNKLPLLYCVVWFGLSDRAGNTNWSVNKYKAIIDYPHNLTQPIVFCRLFYNSLRITLHIISYLCLQIKLAECFGWWWWLLWRSRGMDQFSSVEPEMHFAK